MLGIVLALLAALVVICIVFGYSDYSQTSRNSARDLSFLDRTHKKKS
jgi:hypothetical protein